jgi:hypothetical protein
MPPTYQEGRLAGPPLASSEERMTVAQQGAVFCVGGGDEPAVHHPQ